MLTKTFENRKIICKMRISDHFLEIWTLGIQKYQKGRTHLQARQQWMLEQFGLSPLIYRLGLWCYTTFSNISDISWRSVHWWRKSEYLEKTTDLLQVTDKLHNVVSSTHRHERDSNSQYYLSMTSRVPRPLYKHVLL